MKTVISSNFKAKLSLFKKMKKDFKVRSSANYKEIILGKENKMIFNEGNVFSKGLFLFSMVKRDVESYLNENGYITPFDTLPVNCENENYDKEKPIVCLDINNAYWSVAFLKGYITDNTYLKGLENEEFKPLRLSALSSLGMKRVYKVYKNGKHDLNEVSEGNIELQNVYLDIRYSTYGVMLEIANELGVDFYKWKTDCVQFYDTPGNREKAIEVFDSYNLDWKIEG